MRGEWHVNRLQFVISTVNITWNMESCGSAAELIDQRVKCAFQTHHYNNCFASKLLMRNNLKDNLYVRVRESFCIYCKPWLSIFWESSNKKVKKRNFSISLFCQKKIEYWNTCCKPYKPLKYYIFNVHVCLWIEKGEQLLNKRDSEMY